MNDREVRVSGPGRAAPLERRRRGVDAAAIVSAALSLARAVALSLGWLAFGAFGARSALARCFPIGADAPVDAVGPDTDGDGVPDNRDGCPLDPAKVAPGICGCSVPDTDSDGDIVPDCIDGCPLDPGKTAPGICGCYVPDTDSDGDIAPDCIDNCVAVFNYDQTDCDGDNIGDACDTALSNDECAGAIPITVGATVAFSTLCATTSAPTDDGCEVQNDAWFQHAATCSGLLTVSACGTANFDVALSVFSGSSCPSTVFGDRALLGCADGNDGCGTARLKVPVIAGLTYWIRVGGIGAARGSGTLSLACGTVPPCADPLATPRVYTFVVTGDANGIPWSWSILSHSGDFTPIYQPFVSGVSSPGTALDIAAHFAESINPTVAACSTSMSAKAKTTSAGDVILELTSRVPTTPKQVQLWVGAANATPSCRVRTALPACTFNPTIQLLDLPGLDCNGNGIDDTFDVQDGFSTDTNANGIPDECEAQTGTVFCAGDGLAPHAACPCGNVSGALEGAGCLNSLGFGARVRASGAASLTADTLVLQGNGMPNSSALYFQGTSQTALGAGSVFGDGLRCAGGSVTRLGTKINASGASRYPVAGDASVSVRGGVTVPGSVRTYQIWYRNSASFCTVATFNLSNGLQVTWLP